MEIEEIKIRIYPDGRMDTKNAALYTSFSESYLARMRVEGTGPVYIKRNNRIFYKRDVLDAWLNECSDVRSSAEARVKKAMRRVAA